MHHTHIISPDMCRHATRQAEPKDYDVTTTSGKKDLLKATYARIGNTDMVGIYIEKKIQEEKFYYIDSRIYHAIKSIKCLFLCNTHYIMTIYSNICYFYLPLQLVPSTTTTEAMSEAQTLKDDYETRDTHKKPVREGNFAHCLTQRHTGSVP